MTPRKQPREAPIGFWGRVYVKSAAGLLLLTALGKLVMAASDAAVLRQPDPVLGVLLRGEALLAAAILEALVAGCVLRWGAGDARSVLGVAWLANVFAVYRVTAWSMAVTSPCNCLGSLTSVLGLSQETAEGMSVGLIIYLLVGSHGLLAKEGWKAWRVWFRSRLQRESSPGQPGNRGASHVRLRG